MNFNQKTYVFLFKNICFLFFFSEKKFLRFGKTAGESDFCSRQGIRGNFLKDNYSIIKYFVNLQINYTEQLKKNKKQL